MNHARATPEAVGPYRLDACLGRGGMGEVYRGFDPRLERPVALKRLHLADRARDRDRFRREARSVARVNHSAIVRLYDWLEDDGEDWIVMELVEGRGLNEIVAEERFEPRLVAHIGRQIAAGLAAAHGVGLVHRDLKSENVMLTAGGEVRILDFGLARRVEAEDGVPVSERISRTGEIVGTATAMSPEQALGLEVDHRSDLFSLGSLLYELLSGVLPFEGQSAVETLTRVCTFQPEPLSRQASDVPEELIRIVECLLEKDPLHRPPGARRVAEALDAVFLESAASGILSEPSASASRIVSRLVGEPPAEAVVGAPTGPESTVAVEAALRNLIAGDGLDAWRPAPGAAIPRRPNWSIERCLGSGGFGEAWLGRHRKSGAQRVFKFCWERRRIRSLQREITVFRLLKEEIGQRRDITAIIDWNLDEPPYFLESEYSSGGDLAAWCKGAGGVAQISLDQRLEIVAQVADALAAAHSIGVLHKDIKPTNVLIEERDDRVQARLGDFGVGAVIDPGRLVAAGITALGMTEEDDSGGTPLYRAPELLEGKAASVQADIYALGVMLYQMVVGDLDHALAPGWRRDVDDPELRDDIAAAVEGAPDRRLGDASQLAGRLRGLEARREQRRAAERSARLVEEAMQSRQRWRWMLVAIAGLLIFAVTALVQRQQTARQAERANREAQRANHEAEVAREVSGFLLDMFESSDPMRAGRRTEDLTVREVLDQGADRLRGELANQPEIRASLLTTIGSAYVGLGFYDRGEELLREGMQVRETTFGEASLEVADSLERLRNLLRQGRARRGEVEALDERILEIRQCHLGPDHPEVARVALRLGFDYTVAARYEDAEPLLARSLSIYEQEYGSDHPNVAEALLKLAIFHSAQAQFDRAVPAMERALLIRERHLGPEHTKLVHTLSNLAMIYRHQRRYDASERTVRRAVAICEQALGPEHPQTAQMLSNLGNLLVAARRFDEAEPVLNRSLRLLKKNASPFYTARPLAGLGTVARERGDLELGESHYLRALELWREWGENKPHAIEPIRGLAVVRSRQGLFGEAEELFQRALAVQEKRSPEHPEMADILTDWAEFLRLTGRGEEAKIVDQRVAKLRARHDG